MSLKDRNGWWRLRWIAAAAAAIAAAGLILALPQLLSRTVARRILATRADRLLAPGSLEARAVRLSWSGPTAIEGVVLRDGRGARLVAADRALVDWGLWRILVRPTESISLSLPGAAIDIERLPDGRIDLAEALRPIVREPSGHRLVIAIAGGRLRFRDPALAEPIAADRADISIDIPRDPDPITWDVALGRGSEEGRLAFKGRAHRTADATISLEATRWPAALALSGGLARAEVDGRLAAQRRDDRWTISGEATATEPDAANPGSTRRGPIRAACEVEGQSGTWTARRLELAMPQARITGGGTVADPGGKVRLDLKGTLEPDWEAIQADLRRDVEPNARIAGRAREWRLAGTIGGEGDRLAGLDVELGVELDALDVYGMRLSRTAVVLRADGGRLRLDPIDARLNDGTLHLEPEIVRPRDGPWRIRLGAASTLEDAAVNDEVSHRVLSYVAPVLDGATRVRGRVSVRRLDAEFPVGEAAGSSARVEGDVLFDDVRFLPGPLAGAILDLFPNAPRLDAEPMLVLRDPISFRIADRTVYQHGLGVPIGRLGSADLEGSVDFERRLDLVARFRVNPPQADRPVLAALLNNARLELPIGGTLDHPRIDPEALRERLRSLGSDMVGNSVVAGAEGLLRLLEGNSRRREALKPPAGAAPRAGPPSAEERRGIRERRRLERLEKKAERRMRRGAPPE